MVRATAFFRPVPSTSRTDDAALAGAASATGAPPTVVAVARPAAAAAHPSTRRRDTDSSNVDTAPPDVAVTQWCTRGIAFRSPHGGVSPNGAPDAPQEGGRAGPVNREHVLGSGIGQGTCRERAETMVGAYVDAHRGDRPGDGGREGLPRGTTARTARIAALPLAFTGRAVAGWGRRLAGADPDAPCPPPRWSATRSSCSPCSASCAAAR
jgi:hypothetical protein